MRYVIQDEVIFHPVSGELVLLDMRSGEYLGLDDIGSEIWRLIAEGVAAEEMACHLAERYGADPAVVKRDLAAFLDDLREADLIRAAG